MKFGRLSQVVSLALLAASLPAFALPRAHRGPTSHSMFSKRKAVAAKPLSQRVIAPERATEIQNALVKNGYMTTGSGTWDSATQTAMEKFQADNGWQTKLVPDSRAIIKLGLGPNNTAANELAGSEVRPVQTVE
jgi:hypothetical protein